MAQFRSSPQTYRAFLTSFSSCFWVAITGLSSVFWFQTRLFSVTNPRYAAQHPAADGQIQWLTGGALSLCWSVEIACSSCCKNSNSDQEYLSYSCQKKISLQLIKTHHLKGNSFLDIFSRISTKFSLEINRNLPGKNNLLQFLQGSRLRSDAKVDPYLLDAFWVTDGTQRDLENLKGSKRSRGLSGVSHTGPPPWRPEFESLLKHHDSCPAPIQDEFLPKLNRTFPMFPKLNTDHVLGDRLQGPQALAGGGFWLWMPKGTLRIRLTHSSDVI